MIFWLTSLTSNVLERFIDSKDIISINSGLSNLDNNCDFDQDKVIISNAYVDGGPVMKRFRPRAMGRASQILKRTSHLTITLSEKG